jgi:hypothetical protein
MPLSNHCPADPRPSPSLILTLILIKTQKDLRAGLGCEGLSPSESNNQ